VHGVMGDAPTEKEPALAGSGAARHE